MRSPLDTIAAIATPLGEGGLGVIRVSGPSAVAVVNQLFRSEKIKDLNLIPSHTCHFGAIVGALASPGLTPPSPTGRGNVQGVLLPSPRGRGDGGEASAAIDQVIVTIFRSPHSYTGEDVVEISAHGSPLILEQILQCCLAAGARTAEAGEFTERAFLNGKIDLTQAEAVADLIHAKTEKSRAAAMAQLEGSLAAEVRRLRDELLPLLAHVEVGLDHSDEDHDFLHRRQLVEKCTYVEQSLERILDSERVGKILRNGLRVALVGRPNVGKSSLLNALLKENRAIVTPIAGTTRDTLEETVNWDGLPVVLTDTAGLRGSTDDPIEQLGMDRSQRAIEASDILLVILDGSVEMTDQDWAILKNITGRPHIITTNKADLPRVCVIQQNKSSSSSAVSGRGSRNAVLLGSPPAAAGNDVVNISAKTGEGIRELVAAVKRFADGAQASSSQARWMLNARHQAALLRAQDALARAREAAQADTYEECVAMELQAALSALGEIIGETATDDLLGQIFSQFCIGK